MVKVGDIQNGRGFRTDGAGGPEYWLKGYPHDTPDLTVAPGCVPCTRADGLVAPFSTEALVHPADLGLHLALP